jgi:TetR/AcrR family transcriptional repressor of nem operon
MRQSREEKAKTHQRIVELASARIREEGLDGPGVAEVMQAAGLTHGGFYKHFGSRDDLVAEAAEHAFAYADRTLGHYARDPHDPMAAWVDWYVSEQHRDDPGAGRCPVAALVAASTLVGSLALSRAVDDEALSQEILKSARDALGPQRATTR